MDDSIRILAIDDHALFRESLVRLLQSESDFEVVGHCGSIGRAREILCLTTVDLVLLDYDLGDESGVELLRELQRRAERTRVLVVTAGRSDAVTVEVLNAGAVGVLHKDREPAQLIEAIRKISKGELWLDSGAVRSLIAGTKERAEGRPSQKFLNARQRQVLFGILEGLSNKEIAWKLEVSTTTIKDAVQELFEKAGVRTRSQLVRVALEKHADDWLARDKA
jgi:two-component system, NarL family, nitrate/nitrite response regulator NarL